MTTNEKQLVTKYADQAFKGSFVRQENPTCQCGKVYSVKELCDAPAVYFREVDVLGKTVTLIEPVCPFCRQKIQASYNILN